MITDRETYVAYYLVQYPALTWSGGNTGDPPPQWIIDEETSRIIAAHQSYTQAMRDLAGPQTPQLAFDPATLEYR